MIYNANKCFFRRCLGTALKSMGQGLFSQGQLHMATVVLGEEIFSV